MSSPIEEKRLPISCPLPLEKEIKGEVRYAVPMAEYTSFRVGGPVDFLFFPADAADLKKILEWGRKEKIPYFILGKGTNLLVRDGGWRGMAISLIQGFSRIAEVSRGEREVILEVEAGVPLEGLINFCRINGLAGLEFAAGIPGSVGGAIYMNAGAFGGEIKQVLESVGLMDSQGNILRKERGELEFSYRSLRLAKGEIILDGLFKLGLGEPSLVRAKIEEIITKRKEKQPYEFPSAGSVFRNPQAGPAGGLIEKVGLKGYQIGEAQISEKHANFIINRGQARAKDILSLIELARCKVFREIGVLLELEIQVVGEDA